MRGAQADATARLRVEELHDHRRDGAVQELQLVRLVLSDRVERLRETLVGVLADHPEWRKEMFDVRPGAGVTELREHQRVRRGRSSRTAAADEEVEPVPYESRRGEREVQRREVDVPHHDQHEMVL